MKQDVLDKRRGRTDNRLDFCLRHPLLSPVPMPRALRIFFRNPLFGLAFLSAFCAVAPTRVWGQADAPAFERALAKPFRASLGRQSLGGMLNAVRDATGVAYWLDRRIDPGQSVTSVTVGPTVEQAYTQVAHAADLAAFPVDGLVVVGRSSWVDRVGAAWLSQTETNQHQPSPISAEWPPLTTPNEALARTGFDTSALDLPHDLWPGMNVQSVQASTLLLLIGAQFDLWLEPGERAGLQSRPLPEQPDVIRRYPNSARLKRLRAAALEREPDIKWRVEQQDAVVQASPGVHRLIIKGLRHDDAALPQDARHAPARRPQPSTEQAKFRFNLKNAPAGAALATLAKSAGWQLEITPPARAACEQLISFDDEDDATLEQWVQRIAEKIGVKAIRDGDKLRIEIE